MHRRHAGGERQRRFAAFERGERGFEAILGRVALALVFVAGDGVRRRAHAGTSSTRWIGGATAPVSASGSAPACTASVAGCNVVSMRSSRQPLAMRKASRAASMVCAISASPCALDMKPASNADGARYTPRSSIAWKKRLNAAASQAIACA